MAELAVREGWGDSGTGRRLPHLKTVDTVEAVQRAATLRLESDDGKDNGVGIQKSES